SSPWHSWRLGGSMLFSGSCSASCPLGPDRDLDPPALDPGRAPGPEQRRGVLRPVRPAPRLALLRPPADARPGREPGRGGRGGGDVAAGAAAGVHRLVRRLDLADGPPGDTPARPAGGPARRAGPERGRLLRRGGRDARPARRPAPVLLAA